MSWAVCELVELCVMSWAVCVVSDEIPLSTQDIPERPGLTQALHEECQLSRHSLHHCQAHRQQPQTKVNLVVYALALEHMIRYKFWSDG